MTGQRFQNLTGAPEVALARPEVAGAVAVLVAAIGAGHSIHASAQSAAPIAARDDGEAQWLCCQTAGSTGAPKIIRRAPGSWITSFEVNRDLFDLTARDSYAVLGHLGHSLALYGLCEAMHLGAAAHVLTGLGPRAQGAELGGRGVTVLYATPAQLRLLVQAAPRAGWPALRLIMSGGGKLDPATRASLAQLCPRADLREFFGASETSFVTLTEPDTPPESVGRPYPGVMLELRGGDGRTGEIWLRSPYLFQDYVAGDSDDTRRAGGWLTIGEMGRMDAAGNLYLLGRRNRMVTVADHNVFPEAIERILTEAAPDRASAVVAVGDARRGHHLVAFLTGPEDRALVRDLGAKVGEALGPQAVPRRMRFVADLPMLAAGKPDLAALARMAEASA